MSKILITSALPYINGVKHLGNLVGSLLPADVHARFRRQVGDEVLFICGTDEHGTPVMVAADAAGESPHDTAERFNQAIREDLRDLGLSYDLYTRTTTRRPCPESRGIWVTIHGEL